MSGNTLAMLPWFPRDWLASTRAMRLAERGAYRDLLDYQWEMGKLPASHERLSRLLGCTAEEFEQVWPAIEAKFVVSGDYLFNQRLEEHREKAVRQRDKKVQGANSTNAKRYGERHAERDTNPSHSDSLSGSPPSPSPSPSPSSESLGDTSPPVPKLSGAINRADAANTEPAPRGTRIPIPFEITESMEAWARRSTPGLDLTEATAEFEDFWKAVPGAKGRKLDWVSTWRNRMRELHKRNRQSLPKAVSRYDLLTRKVV